MKRIRYFLVAALAAGSVSLGAAPASAGACNPDTICPDCNASERVQVIWRKVFGHDLECE